MVQKNFELEKDYEKGCKLSELFNINSLGLLTKRDKFITDFNQLAIETRLNDFVSQELSNESLSKKFDLKLKDNDKWDLIKSRNIIQTKGIDYTRFRLQNYRCFDQRVIYYDTNFVARLNTKVLSHFDKPNISIISTRQLADNNFHHIFVSNTISDQCFISNKTKEGCQVFPLYLYPSDTNQHSITGELERLPNLNTEIVSKIESGLKLAFTIEKEVAPDTFAPIDILDYIYAVLHSPTYRETYKEFLKIDFPRVPYPTDKETFWSLVKLGSENLVLSNQIKKQIMKSNQLTIREIRTILFETEKYTVIGSEEMTNKERNK
jgi:predicted helicase